MTDLLRENVVAAVGQHYDLEDEIGRGGMAVVYRARDRRLQRPVAIKVLPPELAYDPAIRARFTREAQTSAQLSHAHIVPIYDVGEREGIAYFVMAFIKGGSLATLLAREPRQPVEEVRRLLCEIADALEYAHVRGVIHRDIKPDNILLDSDSGRAMVVDFGIARAMEAGARLTVTGNAVGTPTYMSPEQAMGEREVDGRSDLYSLGVLAYQMLTGRVPFTAGNSMALLLKHVSEPPRPIAELRPDVPKNLQDVVERALLKEPDDRWPSAAAMRDALRTERTPATSWRASSRAQVRYTSPRPASRHAPALRDAAGAADALVPASAAPVDPSAPVMVPEAYAGLTPAQRQDLRLWHGRIHLMDRIKAMRGYALSTAVMAVAGIGVMIGGLAEGVPPAIFAPVVPAYMSVKLWKRGKSLRAAGLRLRRVLLMPRTKWVIPAPPAPRKDEFEKLAPRHVLDGPHGVAVRRAAGYRTEILSIAATLPKADRALLPELEPTVNGLVERVAHLAQALHRLEDAMDPRALSEIESRLAEVRRETDSPEQQRRVGLLERQRETLVDLDRRRETLARQLDNAVLALESLRLDLIKLRSSGLRSALSDVTSATQEARALSREIGVVLEAAEEVRRL
jgi:serine/threonine-protein kinase